MNLRVVVLEKKEKLYKGCYEILPFRNDAMVGPWVVFGHFDALYSYRIYCENSGLFSAIKDNNAYISLFNNGDNYLFPLYLLSQNDDSEFWDNANKETEGPLAIIRIHYARTIGIGEYLDKLRKDLYAQAINNECLVHIYSTMELSDLILAVKSSQFHHILNFALTLRQHPRIGKVYSYCGIKYDYIADLSWVSPVDDYLPMTTLRFAVRNVKHLQCHIELMEKALGSNRTFLVAGVDDITLDCYDLPISNLIRLYRTLFVPGYSICQFFDSTFSTMITRVGIPFDSEIQYSDSQDNSSAKLVKICHGLIDISALIGTYIYEIQQNDLPQINYTWLKSVLELSKVLYRMSQTPILDEFVYVILPGATAFLQNIFVHIQSFADFEDQQIKKFQHFLENWYYLTEHILRLEGQLSHYPDIRPMIYDIPVLVLEYVLAFLDQVSDILKSNDREKAEINLLLIPRYCERIEAQELFEARGERVGLIQVEIPLEMLYDPSSVLTMLTHEIAHFIGESFRNREERCQKFSLASSILMAKLVFESYDSKLIEHINDRLKKYIVQAKVDRLRPISRVILDWTENLKDDGFYFQFIREVLTGKMEKPDGLKIYRDEASIGTQRFFIFAEILSNVVDLFREVYADICMLYLLSPDSCNYIKSIIGELTVSDKKSRFELLSIRMYVSLTASNIPIPNLTKIGRSEVIDRIEKMFTDLEKMPLTSQESQDRIIPIAVIEQLQEYAEKCFKSLDSTIKTHETVVKSMYDAIEPEMDYQEILRYIELYRKKFFL